MHVIASFYYSTYIETALVELEQRGIQRSDILAVPLNTVPVVKKKFDTVHRSDGTSFIDIGMALGAACSVVTASLGMTLAWGPIYWGLIGAVGGFLVGFLIDLALQWNAFRKRKQPGHTGEVFVLVVCDDRDADMVAELFWEHHAFGVAIVPGTPQNEDRTRLQVELQ